MVGKLLGGGLVLLGTALWCRGEIQARRRETDRTAELAAALGEMAAEIRSLRRPMPRLLERQARRSLCGGCFARVLWGLERGWRSWRTAAAGTAASGSGFCGRRPCPGRGCSSSY